METPASFDARTAPSSYPTNSMWVGSALVAALVDANAHALSPSHGRHRLRHPRRHDLDGARLGGPFMIRVDEAVNPHRTTLGAALRRDSAAP